MSPSLTHIRQADPADHPTDAAWEPPAALLAPADLDRPPALPGPLPRPAAGSVAVAQRVAHLSVSRLQRACFEATTTPDPQALAETLQAVACQLAVAVRLLRSQAAVPNAMVPEPGTDPLERAAERLAAVARHPSSRGGVADWLQAGAAADAVLPGAAEPGWAAEAGASAWYG